MKTTDEAHNVRHFLRVRRSCEKWHGSQTARSKESEKCEKPRLSASGWDEINFCHGVEALRLGEVYSSSINKFQGGKMRGCVAKFGLFETSLILPVIFGDSSTLNSL